MLVLLVSGAGLGGCKDCYDDYVVPSYRIIVQDAQTGARICDATVTVDGGLLHVHSASCTYVANIPNSGKTATLDVARDGYQPLSKTLSTAYEADDCGHAMEVNVTVKLSKS